MKTTISRRTILAGAAAVAAMATTGARAQGYPDKPLRWFVGYPPGGGSDTIARIVGEGMAKDLGQPVIVDNRPGASANLAGRALVSSPADGYTLMNPDNGLLIFNPILYKSMGFNPTKEMKPVGRIGRLHLVIAVQPNHPAKTFKDLLQLLRKKDNAVPYAASSIGSPLHLAMVRLQKDAHLNISHIPYKGAAPAIQDFLAGIVELICVDYSSGSQHIKSGKMRPLAVASDKRIATLPDVPTIAESGLRGFEAYAWQGLVVPAKTSDEVTSRLHTALAKTLATKQVIERLELLGIEPMPSKPEEMASLILKEEAIWHPIVRRLGVTLD